MDVHVVVLPAWTDSAVGRAPRLRRRGRNRPQRLVSRANAHSTARIRANSARRGSAGALVRHVAATRSVPSQYHFDTHHFVQRLEREALSREQAEGVMASLTSVIEEAARNVVLLQESRDCCSGGTLFALAILLQVAKR